MGNTPGNSDAGNAGTNGELPGMEVVLNVSDDRTLLRLKDGRVDTDAEGNALTDWDLAFEGWDIFTNSGPSGPGSAQSFGPFDELNFLFGDEPAVPFLRADRTGGVFEGWYAYDGEGPILWSRYHVYAVRDGARLWKVQILRYYGDLMGVEVSALYQVRYAEVTEDGVLETQTLSVDGTAGGPRGTNEDPSGCLNLATAEVHLLSPSAARAATNWHLCFRRDNISVNGGAGGPGQSSAASLPAEERTLEQLRATTADAELAAFDAVSFASLRTADLSYQEDRVLSSFTDTWFEGQAPVEGAWLVVSADGMSRHLLVFTGVEGATERSPGTLTLQVREVEQAQ